MKNNVAKTEEIINLAEKRAYAAGEPPWTNDWLSPLTDGTRFLVKNVKGDIPWLDEYTILNRSKMAILLEFCETDYWVSPTEFCSVNKLIEILTEGKHD